MYCLGMEIAKLFLFFLVRNIQLSWFLMALSFLYLDNNSRILITLEHKQIILVKFTVVQLTNWKVCKS